MTREEAINKIDNGYSYSFDGACISKSHIEDLINEIYNSIEKDKKGENNVKDKTYKRK